MSTHTITPVTLEDPWIIHTEDYADYACEEHAREWAEEQGIPADGYGGYAQELEGHGTIASAYAVWPYAEADYPIACNCGQYLKTHLTPDGVAYMEEREFPQEVVSAYLPHAD